MRQSLRRRLLLVALITPPALTALAVAGVEAWRIADSRSTLFATEPVLSLADALEQHQLEAAYAFIRAGQNPDEPIPVRHPTITGGRTVLAAPLVWAAAVENREGALMLLGFGAAAREIPRAICVAEARGRMNVAATLRTLAPEALPCVSLTADDDFLGALFPGGRLQSPDGQFRLIYQDDGNLVLYDQRSGAVTWASNTDGTTAGRAALQRDGRFVVYDAEGTPRWTSGSRAGSGAVLVLQDDGNVVVRGRDGALHSVGTAPLPP